MAPVADPLRVMQVIATAILSGAVMFQGIALTWRGTPGAWGASSPITLMLAVISAVLAIGSQLLARRLFAGPNEAMPGLDGYGVWLQRWRLNLIFRLAALEGASLMNSVAYFIDGGGVSLVMNAFILAGMCRLIPTRTTLKHELELVGIAGASDRVD